MRRFGVCLVKSIGPPGGAILTGYIYEGVPVDRSSSTGRDADGTRVSKGTITAWSCDPAASNFQPTTDYVLGPGGEQLTEMGMDENGQMAWKHTNIWAAGKLLATYDPVGLHYHLSDWLGTRRMQLDTAGAVEAACTSLPYGDALYCNNSTYTTKHHFTGKERDIESGNDYFGARYYASPMGRWLSPDWGGASPVPYASFSNPQSLNLYSYMGNDPLGGPTRMGIVEFA
jgi:RHS repeat-associated protein